MRGVPVEAIARRKICLVAPVGRMNVRIILPAEIRSQIMLTAKAMSIVIVAGITRAYSVQVIE